VLARALVLRAGARFRVVAIERNFDAGAQEPALRLTIA